jgi:hypothetical protein
MRAGPKKKWKSAFQIGLWAELNAQKEWYLKNEVFIDEDIKKITELLPKHGSVSTQHWFYTPDCSQLAADTFIYPIHFHTSSGAILYLPLTRLPYWKISNRSPPPSRPYHPHQVYTKISCSTSANLPNLWKCLQVVRTTSIGRFLRPIVAFMDHLTPKYMFLGVMQ